ncbi:MAG: hypothetical protein JXA89_18200 [Anaerolineae bacterium]|nr:hypothetical protein [Anaerolineae bacterium]
MKQKRIPAQNIVRLRKNQDIPNIYDVEIEGIEYLKRYHSIECHIVLYPYSRKISSEDVSFYPFEEYVKDVLSQQRSAYALQQDRFNEVFGLLLGLVIALAFWIWDRQALLSIESIVSVFAAYTVGKELWDDIDRMLVEVSKQWKLRYRDSYYQYVLEKHTTLTAYSMLAKEKRYGKAPLLPEKIDFIKQSNSQTLRMWFKTQDLMSFRTSSAHVLSIHVEPDLLKDLEDDGFLFGVKLSLNRRFLGITRHLELFQSLNHDAPGCLEEKCGWVSDAVFYRDTFTLGRLKFFAGQGLIHGKTIVAT